MPAHSLAAPGVCGYQFQSRILNGHDAPSLKAFREGSRHGVDAQRAYLPRDAQPTADGPIESDQETIPRRVHIPAMEPRQLPSHNDLVLLQQFTPFPVTNLCCLPYRVDVELTISVKRAAAKSRCLGGHTEVSRSKRLSSTLPSLKYPVSMITDDLFCGLV